MMHRAADAATVFSLRGGKSALPVALYLFKHMPPVILGLAWMRLHISLMYILMGNVQCPRFQLPKYQWSSAHSFAA
jgi:hypothetical protein